VNSLHFLTCVGNVTVFADRIDGYSKITFPGTSSPRYGEFTVYMSNGNTFRVMGEEKNVVLEHEHLVDILTEQEDGDVHPMGQSG
jgi:hypothetical protein